MEGTRRCWRSRASTAGLCHRWLIIAEEAFLPADSGARTETLAFLQACDSQGIISRVWIPGPDNDRRRYEQALPNCPVEFLPRAPAWRAHASMRPYVIASRPFSRRVSAALLGDLARWQPTAVISATFRVSHIGLETARAVRVPLLVRPHNLESEYFARLAISSRGVSRLAYRLEAAKLRRFERRVHALPDIAGFADLSQAEARKRQLLTDRPVYHLPPFLPSINASPAGSDTSTDVLFLGSLDNANNVDGLRWFLDSVWPSVLAKYPGLNFRVVGRRPSRPVAEMLLSTRNVIPMVDVPNLEEAFAHTAVFVNPVRRGAGVNMKVVEAAARGVAMVSTSVGLRGLNFVPGVDAYLADEPDRFASATAELLNDAQLRRRLGSSARARVTTMMDHGRLIDRMRTMLTMGPPAQAGCVFKPVEAPRAGAAPPFEDGGRTVEGM